MSEENKQSLIVDDATFMRCIIKNMLQKNGFDVKIVSFKFLMKY